MNPSVCSGPNCVWRFFLSCFFLLVLRASAQQITVDITPGHSTNAFSPLYAMGAGIDRDPLNSVQKIYGPTDVSKMLSAGWGAMSYRLNTELSIQAGTGIPRETGATRTATAISSEMPEAPVQSAVRSATTCPIAA